MKRSLCGVLVAGALIMGLAGCSSGPPEESKEMRDMMTGKGEKFDINNVPPEHREATLEAIRRHNPSLLGEQGGGQKPQPSMQGQPSGGTGDQ